MKASASSGARISRDNQVTPYNQCSWAPKCLVIATFSEVLSGWRGLETPPYVSSNSWWSTRVKDQGESSVCAGGHAEAVTETKQSTFSWRGYKEHCWAHVWQFATPLLNRCTQENRNCLYSLGTYIYHNQYLFLDFENWSTNLGMMN